MLPSFAAPTTLLIRTRCRRPIHSPLPLCRRLATAVSTSKHPPTAQHAFKPPSALRSTTHMLRFRRSRLAAHLTELHLRGAPTPPMDSPSRMDAALASAGNAHEANVLARLVRDCAAGAPPAAVPRNHPDRHRLTAAALRAGVPVVHQPALTDGLLMDGYADILLRNSHNPFLPAGGVYPEGGYSVIEVKLASTAKADYALQAAAYTEMLGIVCAEAGLPPPGPPFLWLGAAAEAPVALPAADAAYFYRSVRRAFAEFVAGFDVAAPWPGVDAPVREMAPWTEAVGAWIRERDSLLQVAGIRRAQVRALEKAGVGTMQQLAEMSVTQVVDSVECVGRAPLEVLQKQAELQVASRSRGAGSGMPVYEVRSVSATAPHGLHRLPPRSSDDVFFDMEGFPLVQGGLEYLLGASFEEGGGLGFRSWWAHDRAAEEQQFAACVEWLWRRWQDGGSLESNGMHVYHYGHYEVTALRRVACRALTSAGVQAGIWLEDLLESGVFVDIYKTVKTSLVVGEPSYSIKNIEKLVGVSREGDELADAESSVAMYYEWRRAVLDASEAGGGGGQGGGKDRNLLGDIELYNKQDCESLDSIVQWLRRAAELHNIPYSRWIPPSAALSREDSSGVDGEYKARLARGACGSSPDRKSMDSEVIRRCDQISMDLLRKDSSRLQQVWAHLLGFHVRETDPARGRFGDRVSRASSGDLSSLFVDDQCLSCVWKSSAVSSDDEGVEGRGRATAYFEYDPLEPHRLEPGDSCALVHSSGPLKSLPASSDDEAEVFEPVAGFVRVRESLPGYIGLDLGSKLSLPDATPSYGALISSDELIICPSTMRASILESASNIRSIDDGTLGMPPILLNYLERIGYQESKSGQCLYPRRDELSGIIACLDGRTFIIQGPPGTGKTVTSAALIADLIFKYGMTVAVSSNSHAAIDNLLERAVRNGVPPREVLKIGPKSPPLDQLGIRRATSISGARICPVGADGETSTKSASLVGGTAYALSSLDAAAKFDILFVDEAGQVPMANFVAMARCASSAVLVGDQQQLDMPLQGRHPNTVDKSCLTYFIGEDVTIVPPSQGLFLETSYRMAPGLCEFVSRTMYNNALVSAESAAAHNVLIPPSSAGDGLLPAGTKVSGLRFLNRDRRSPVRDYLNKVLRGRRHCPTEVQIAAMLVSQLVGAEYTAKGATATLEASDVMVVAPYNVQVGALRDALPPGVRVGTIDKFQGQEAPVVIISTCALPEGDADESDDNGDAALESEADSSSDRGTWFALHRKRLNVALSRAQCLAIVIGPEELATRASANSLDDASVLAFYAQIVDASSAAPAITTSSTEHK